MARTAKQACLIINGKSAQNPQLREAVTNLRERGHRIDVNVTWEQGDGARFAKQAGRHGVERLIVGGGDGTVHEVVNGLMELDRAQRPAIGVIPLGSANDLASSLEIPLEPQAALETALAAAPCWVDVPSLNDQYFINMVSGGFGAEITSSTPKTLKSLLGGGAYSLMGMLNAWRYKPYSGRLRWEGGECDVPLFLLAIGNGSQAGGGQRVAPAAKLNDGLVDVLIVRDYETLPGMKRMLDEFDAMDETISLPYSGEFIDYVQTSWLSFESDTALPLTLDGEFNHHARFEIRMNREALRLLAPASCVLL
ncbi:lipid kinase YegS [Pistricoccus aurantiacus]|uniref:Lipid kinase YegS n=1 Tax=Pistricoccus aurantiacus TaxID=1883414 RepID=A0A5B8SY65_9GAMM|nr:lipid kinase YegS [Pistricoccus aurantiacus]QEA40445.1 lipid kinase YegS [Pistricoccus aurantiacus]